LGFAAKTFEIELSSVTDNPIVFADDGAVLSAGNFHGEPLGFALDFMAAALSELASISERRTDRILDPHHSNGLPPFLAPQAGINSGYMLTQYTQAALVAENRILSTPATVDTIPTSGTYEDHVSMGWNAALKLRRVIGNVAKVLAVEALCAAQGIDFRAPLKPGDGVAKAHGAVRRNVPSMTEDRELGSQIEAISEVILSGELGAF
jgi:histidine ammonia-lyase